MSNTHPLHDLAGAIRAKHMEANATAQRAVMLAAEAGQLLIEAKGQVEHGEWSDWLSQNCQFSDRTARTYMSLARRLPGLDDEKRQRVAVLPLRQAIKELREDPIRQGKQLYADLLFALKEAVKQIRVIQASPLDLVIPAPEAEKLINAYEIIKDFIGELERQLQNE